LMNSPTRWCATRAPRLFGERKIAHRKRWVTFAQGREPLYYLLPVRLVAFRCVGSARTIEMATTQMSRFEPSDKRKLLRAVHKAKPLYDRAVKVGKVWDDLSKVGKLLAAFAACFITVWLWWTKEPAPKSVDASAKQEVVAPITTGSVSKAETDQKAIAPAEKKELTCITDSMATVYETLTNADRPRAVARRLYVGRDVCAWMVIVIGIRGEDDGGWRIMVETAEGLRLVVLVRARRAFELKDRVRISGKVGDLYSGTKDELVLSLQSGKVEPCLDCTPTAKEGE
jgi:hypothetical protein